MAKQIVFPESEGLIKLIEDNNWSLADAVKLGEYNGDLAKFPAAKKLEFNVSYTLIPTPKPGEKTNDVIARINNSFTSLIIPNKEEFEAISGQGAFPFRQGNFLYVFSRLYFIKAGKKKGIVGSYPGAHDLPEAPLFLLPGEEEALDKFRKYFKIISKKDFQDGIYEAQNQTRVIEAMPIDLFGNGRRGEA